MEKWKFLVLLSRFSTYPMNAVLLLLYFCLMDLTPLSYYYHLWIMQSFFFTNIEMYENRFFTCSWNFENPLVDHIVFICINEYGPTNTSWIGICWITRLPHCYIHCERVGDCNIFYILILLYFLDFKMEVIYNRKKNIHNKPGAIHNRKINIHKRI